MSNTMRWMILCLMMSFSLSPVRADVWQVFTKSIEKEFPLGANGLTEIQNQWGTVRVDTWDKNQVKIVVNFKIQTLGKKKGQKILDHLSVDFLEAEDRVVAKTKVSDPKKINWYKRSNVKVAIDYQVYIPANGDLKLDHHHGDVFLGTLLGKVDIRLKSGNLQGTRLGTQAKVAMVHGEAKVDKAGELALQLNLASFSARETGDLHLAIKHSKVNIDFVEKVDGTSTFGHFKLGEVKSFAITGRYDTVAIAAAQDVAVSAVNSIISVDQLDHSLELNMELGKFTSTLSATFSSIDLQGKHTRFRLNVPQASNFNMDVSARHSQVEVPAELVAQYQVRTTVNKTFIGVYGQETNQRWLKARFSNGSLRIAKI